MKGNRYIDPSVKQEYLEWLMTPPGEREPATKEALATQLGVSYRTLFNWEGEPEFQEELRKLRSKWGTRWYPDILNRLMQIVENGPPAQAVQAAKTLLAHIDMKPEDAKAGEYSDEELKRISELIEKAGYEVMD